MDLIEVTRRSFTVVAVRVTEEHMARIAEWCRGAITSARLVSPGDTQFIELSIRKGAYVHTSYAHIGDWITKNGEQFKVYKHASFMGTFDQRPKTDPESKRRVLNELLQTRFIDGMTHKTTFGDLHEAIDEVTEVIMKMFEGEK
jgi:hypothetical protein